MWGSVTWISFSNLFRVLCDFEVDEPLGRMQISDAANFKTAIHTNLIYVGYETGNGKLSCFNTELKNKSIVFKINELGCCERKL